MRIKLTPEEIQNPRKTLMDTDRIELLLGVLRSYAPSEEEGKKIERNFGSTADTTMREILIELTSALYNGLTYGNWPWSERV